MLLGPLSSRRASPPVFALRRRLTQSMTTALDRQDARMPTSPKRNQWSEADVLALPAGEHDYFERKSGQIFSTNEQLYSTLAKALSAFANSGGGHLLLGVADDGSFDGVPTHVGRTRTRDWLEQKVPQLVEHPLSDFRVHEVQPDPASSQIPPGCAVIVIDIGDSALAPHQCAFGGRQSTKYLYYHRQGGRSAPAPHFYLELLRQRLTNPTLTATPTDISYVRGAAADRHSEYEIVPAIVILLALRMRVENIGRVAAYKWMIQWRATNLRPDRQEEYILDRSRFPVADPEGGIRVDDTILPGASMMDRLVFGLWLPVTVVGSEDVARRELTELLADVNFEHRIATETGLTDWSPVRLGDHLDVPYVIDAISRIAL